MRILYWSGSININSMGATKSIDTALTRCFTDLGHEVIWIGRGICPSAYCDYYDVGNNRLLDFSKRVIDRISRLIFNTRVEKIVFNEYVEYDRRMAELIRSQKIKVNSDTVFIGRNGMSLLSMQEVNSRGGKTVLHSQFMHPTKQNELVTNSFRELGIQGRAVSEKRAMRQIAEIKLADAIWCISSLVKNSYSKFLYSKDKLFFCPLGVDSLHFSKGQSKSDLFTIIFVGNINPEKGVHILMDALLSSDLKKCKVIFNGAVAPYFRSIFDDYCKKLQSKGHIVMVQAGPPLKNYRKSDVFVLPSVHESFGLVVLEAMSVGLPVVVSSNVGAKDCVQHEKNGFVFKSGSALALTGCLETLYHNPALRDEMSRKSLMLSKKFEWNVISIKLAQEVKKVLQQC